MSKRSRIVIVCGMHRSGTSAMSGLLHNNGVVMGREEKKEFFPPPQIQNPKGFFENKHFRQINDNLLKKINYHVKSFDPKISKVYAHIGDQRPSMISLVKGYQREFTHWGWKDPRTCLTLYAWFDVFKELRLLENLRIVVMFRSFYEIAESMRRRNNRETREYQFFDLCIEYYKKLFYYLNSFNSTVSFKVVDFYDLLHFTRPTCDSLGLFIDKDIIDTSFIDPSISSMSAQNRKRLLKTMGLDASGRPRKELMVSK
jgi:hypothetical protein